MKREKQVEKANTYICGADGELCEISKSGLPAPCQICERNKHWKAKEHNEYKIKVLQHIIDKGDSCGFYGVLSSRAGETKRINIDRGALEALVKYYENNIDE